MPKVITGIMLHPNNDTYSRAELDEFISLGQLYIVTCSEDITFDFNDFISTNDAESSSQVTDINDLTDFETTNTTTVAWSDDPDSGFWTATIRRIDVEKLIKALPIREITRDIYNWPKIQHGSRQALLLDVDPEFWENMVMENHIDDMTNEDEPKHCYHQLGQNESFVDEPEELIGYLPCWDLDTLLDGMSDWQQIVPAMEAVARNWHVGKPAKELPTIINEEFITLHDDCDSIEVRVNPDKTREFLDYILDNWECDEFFEATRDIVRNYLTTRYGGQS